MWIVHVIFLILYYLPVNLYAQIIDYSFQINPCFIRISLETTGNKTGTTRFLLPLIFQNSFEENYDLKYYIDDLPVQAQLNGDYAVLSHNPLSKIRLEYSLYDNNFFQNTIFYKSNNDFLLTHYCLAKPDINKKEIHQINFYWPNYTHTISSNNATSFSKEYTQEMSIQKLNHIFFIGGDHVMIHDTTDQKYFFLTKDTIYKEKLLQYINAIHKIQRDFFQYTAKVFPIFIFVPDFYNAHEVSGMNLVDYQVISIGTKQNFDHEVQRIIAHENLHTFFGNQLKQKVKMQSQNAWFMEGFTDYYSAYLNYLYGLWSLNDYLKSYNQCLKEYFTSPFIVATNQIIDNNSKFIHMDILLSLSYLRGRIIAHELSNKIDLDRSIQNLISAASKKNILFNYDVFIHALSQTLSQTVTEYDINCLLRQRLNYIAMSDLPQYILNGKASLFQLKAHMYDFGFDVYKAHITQTVTDLKKDTNAYRAGLRNNDNILELWMPKADNMDTMTIKVHNNDQIKIIKFKVILKETMIPQYRPSAPLSKR
ncbi:MAG: hypothetical protein AB8B67_04950 [Rickettsiaceae bacterium]